MPSKNEKTEGCGQERSFKDIWQSLWPERSTYWQRLQLPYLQKEAHGRAALVDTLLWWLFFSSSDFSETILAQSFFYAFSFPSPVSLPPSHQPLWPASSLWWPCRQPCPGQDGILSALIHVCLLLSVPLWKSFPWMSSYFLQCLTHYLSALIYPISNSLPHQVLLYLSALTLATFYAFSHSLVKSYYLSKVSPTVSPFMKPSWSQFPHT